MGHRDATSAFIFYALTPLAEEVRWSWTTSFFPHCCVSILRVLFEMIHMWAECLVSSFVCLPEPVVPAGWGYNNLIIHLWVDELLKASRLMWSTADFCQACQSVDLHMRTTCEFCVFRITRLSVLHWAHNTFVLTQSILCARGGSSWQSVSTSQQWVFPFCDKALA